MNKISRSIRKSILLGFIGMLAVCSAVPVMAAPPAAQSTTKLQAQLQDVGAQLATAHNKQELLQAQVTQLEQRNVDQQKQVKQRDAKIAALQQQLRAAGVPASAASVGP